MATSKTTRADATRYRVVEAEFVAGVTQGSSLPPPTLAEVAFAGRSNVGKSSLLNGLLQRRGLARTSSTPGRTREINYFRAKLSTGLALYMVDLPGYGYAKVSKAQKAGWGELLEGYLRTRSTLRACVLLVDVRRGLEQQELDLLEFLEHARDVQSPQPLTVLLAVTKVDKLPLASRNLEVQRIAKQAKRRAVGFSATSGEGREELWHRISKCVTDGQEAP
jgi:GTP-binding protein